VYASAALSLLVALYVDRLDPRLWHRSPAGIRALVLYEIGDYAAAADAYRSHWRTYALDTGDAPFDALLAGDLAAAETLANQVLARHPADLGALLTRADVALQREAFDRALHDLARALASHADQFDALLLSSVARARSGEHGAAIDLLNRALRTGVVETRVTSFLQALAVTGELSARVEGRRPSCLLAHYHRYLRIFDDRHTRLARAYAREAIAVGDRPADAWVTIGMTHRRHGENEEALAAFRNALAADPRHAEAYRGAAHAYSLRGDLAHEYQMTKRAFALAPADPYYAGDLTEILMDKLGDYPRALALARRRLANEGESTILLRHVGFLSAWLGDFDASLRYYRRAAALDPDDLDARRDVAWCLARQGRHEEAIAGYQEILAQAPEDARTHHLLALLYRDVGRYVGAADEFERAFRIDRNVAPHLVELCLFQHLTGRFDRAAACLARVLAENPQHLLARTILGLSGAAPSTSSP
jgi:tetratricopeptide (TPR) repeat protein